MKKILYFSLILSILSCRCNNHEENLFAQQEKAINKILIRSNTDVDIESKNALIEKSYLWNKFFTSKFVLPDSSSAIADSSNTQERKDFYERDLELDGNKIDILPWEGATSGIASCKNGRPVIYFSKELSKFTAFGRYVFFREHEFAHHKFKHISCTKKYNFNPNNEFHADSVAVKSLLDNLGFTGELIINNTIGAFSIINDEEFNPPLRERALRMYAILNNRKDINQATTAQKEKIFNQIKENYTASRSIIEFQNKISFLK